MIIKKYYKLIRVSHEDSAYMRLKNVSNEAGIFKMVKTGSPTAPNLEYSLDGTTWTTYDFTTLPEVTVAAGANIYFRGTNADQQFNKSTSAYVSFSFNKSCEGHGNICSLFDPDPSVFSTITTVGTNGLYRCFYGCTSLITAPDLSNVTSIGSYGLNQCFYGCTSLITAPDLSNVTSIGTYGLNGCFMDCTSLITAPDLSNVTSIGSNGLNSCFMDCTSLITAPDLSNVTSIGSYGLYRCFHGCTSLTTGVDLSNATTVDQAAALYMYSNCANISTVTTPNIPDLTISAGTTAAVLGHWLDSAGTQVTGTKTVNVPAGATILTDSTSGIPTGWTRVDY